MSSKPPTAANPQPLPEPPGDEIGVFRSLQDRLPQVWERMRDGTPWEHSTVVVPSLSFAQEELAKIPGVPFYEERLLFMLMRLRHPACRIMYVTSQPIHPDIIDYYLHLLVGVPTSHAWKRLSCLALYDSSNKALTHKILDRPRVIERIRDWIGDPQRAYLTAFNCTPFERRLAVALGIPLNGADPALLRSGTKSGSRQVFRQAGVDLPDGAEDLHHRSEFVDALGALAQRRPGIRGAVVKLDESFSGEGNALFSYPEPLPDAETERKRALDGALDEMTFNAEEENAPSFFRKLERTGGVVEEHLSATEVRSPSVQIRIEPGGQVRLVSTHDQVLGGPMAQAYRGCRFPASEDYRQRIQEAALQIGQVLSASGVASRCGIDFMACRDPGEDWRCAAIEINLRMGGTTHPFLALEFLTSGTFDPESGLFVAPNGQTKYYFSTDGLTSPSYRGLLPEDLMDIITFHDLNYRPTTQKGVLFHMIGALSEFGKVGVTCIGDTRQEADDFYHWTVEVLDRATGATGPSKGTLRDPFHESLPRIE